MNRESARYGSGRNKLRTYRLFKRDMKLKTTLTVLCLISIGVPLLNSVVE